MLTTRSSGHTNRDSGFYTTSGIDSCQSHPDAGREGAKIWMTDVMRSILPENEESRYHWRTPLGGCLL